MPRNTETEIDKGSLLGFYQASRIAFWKRVSLVAVMSISVTGFVLAAFDSKTTTLITGLFAAGIWTLIAMSSFYGNFMMKGFWIKIYKRGLELPQLGFFIWNDVFVYKEKTFIMLVLRDALTRNPNAKWPSFLDPQAISFVNWGDNNDSEFRDACFRFRIPSFLTNISEADFIKILNPYIKVHQPYDTVTRTKKL